MGLTSFYNYTEQGGYQQSREERKFVRRHRSQGLKLNKETVYLQLGGLSTKYISFNSGLAPYKLCITSVVYVSPSSLGDSILFGLLRWKFRPLERVHGHGQSVQLDCKVLEESKHSQLLQDSALWKPN